MQGKNNSKQDMVSVQKIRSLTQEIRKKLEQKACYLINNIRRRSSSNPFCEFDTYHEQDSKTDSYICWEPIPMMIKNVRVKEAIDDSIVCLLNQKWLMKKQPSNLMSLIQTGEKQEKTPKSDTNESKKNQEEKGEGKEAVLPLRFSQAELQEITNTLKTEKVFNDCPIDKALELTHCFDFSNAFIHNGAYSSIKKYFNLSLKTFEAVLDELEIKVADNELTRETEAFYVDKNNQTIYMMSQNELMGLIQHTGIFKTGKHSNQNLRLTAITEQFNVVKPILADENRYNPVKIIFDNVFKKLTPTQDTSKIDAFIDCFIINHGDNLEYEQACKSAIKKFIISAIAAICRPIFNSRLSPIFVGRQGCGKSSFGKKIFDVVEASFLTFGGMKIDKNDHQEQLYRGWVLEIADSPQLFRKQDAFEAYKSLTNPVFKTKRKYENHITTFNRHSVHYFTMNEIDLRDDENTRNPVIRLLGIDVNKMDNLLGLRHVGAGVVETQDDQKKLELWHQVKCCFDRSESYELTAEEQKVFTKFVNKNNKKTVLAAEFEDMFGITDDFEYQLFLSETVKGARYQIVNLKLIASRLAGLLSTPSREVIPQDLDKKTGELNTLINRYFPDINIKSAWCPITKKSVTGFKSPVMLVRSEQEALAAQRKENQDKNNTTPLTKTTAIQEPKPTYQSEYTQEELQKMADQARL